MRRRKHAHTRAKFFAATWDCRHPHGEIPNAELVCRGTSRRAGLVSGGRTKRHHRLRRPRLLRRSHPHNFHSALFDLPGSKRHHSAASRALAPHGAATALVHDVHGEGRLAVGRQSAATRACESACMQRARPCVPLRRAWSNTRDRSTSPPDTSSCVQLSAPRANAHRIDGSPSGISQAARAFARAQTQAVRSAGAAALVLAVRDFTRLAAAYQSVGIVPVILGTLVKPHF